MKESKELEWPEIKQSYWLKMMMIAERERMCMMMMCFNFLFFKKNPAAILLRLQLLNDRIHLYK